MEKEVKIVVFTNKGKAKNERAPDFIVYEDQPRDEFALQKRDEAKSPAQAESEEAKESASPQEDSEIPEVLR